MTGNGSMTQSLLFRTTLASALLATSSLASAQAVGTAAPVRTQQGQIQGAPGKVEGVTVFKNIPFAAPPVGELRFAQPQPPAAWQGVRDGAKYGNVCMQNPAPTRFPPNGATDVPENFTGMSEDCLNLN